MGGSVRKLLWGLVLPLFGFVACQSSKDQMDLAVNPTLYTSPGYHARMPADRPAFMPPIVDDRGSSTPEEASGPFPVTWMPDSYWDRPVVEMVDDTLREELKDSGVFSSIEDTPPPSPDAVVVQVEMTRARCGLEEQAAKRRSMAELTVNVTVRGPVDASGGRDVIWQKEFHEVTASDLLIRPPVVPSMFGRVTQRVVARVVAALDESNVGRSGVPISDSDD